MPSFSGKGKNTYWKTFIKCPHPLTEVGIEDIIMSTLLRILYLCCMELKKMVSMVLNMPGIVFLGK